MTPERPAFKRTLEAAILAGGLSSRMGTNKARLRLNGRPMLSFVREAAHAAGLPVRVVRTDAVPRCGPLGGIVTALLRSKGKAVVFLACDMPFVTTALLERVMRASRDGTRAVFSEHGGRIGFPCLLPATARKIVQAQAGRGSRSLHDLARMLGAKCIVIRSDTEMFNVNTPSDRPEAERLLRRRGKN